jgi:alcohol dehydrogenase, propanol-preferring
MKAVVLHTPAPIEEHPLEVVEIETPTPGRGQVLMRVAACGVCRSNLHMIEGEWVASGVPTKSPIIPGHEVVGTVTEVGEGVTELTPGDRIGVQPLWSTCGRCEYCLDGRDQLCQSKEIGGETVDGGYAEYMLANAAHAYALTDGLEFAQAAALFCPGITAYGCVLKVGPMPGKTVAVFGIGGVGHMVVQFAKLFGADVVAVSRGSEHLALAEDVGASRLVDSTKEDAGDVLGREGGVDASIVFAPSNAVVEQAIRATKPGGTVVTGVNVDVGAFPFAVERRLVGSLLGSRQQMRTVLELAAAGKVGVVAETFPLEGAEEALVRLKAGEIRARAVLVA